VNTQDGTTFVQNVIKCSNFQKARTGQTRGMRSMTFPLKQRELGGSTYSL
jgi:hypothetical protein